MQIIRLTQGYSTLIDDEDFDWLNQYSWRIQKSSKTNYARRGFDPTVTMHVEILQYHNLYIPGYETDHKDRNGLNNQKHNLIVTSHQLNQVNRGMFDNNTSGFKGVSWHRGKWQASIRVNGKLEYLGRYNMKITAAVAYNNAALYYFGKSAYLNVIPA